MRLPFTNVSLLYLYHCFIYRGIEPVEVIQPDGTRVIYPVSIIFISPIHLLTDYCKRCYFRWGKISRKCCQDPSGGGNFYDTSHISLIKESFRKEGNITKNAKITPTQKFPC